VHGIVAVTATVAPAPHGGTVTFTDRGTPIAGCTDIAVSTTTAGRARCATSFASAGIHRLDASYTGDASDAGSSAPGLEVTVIAKPVLSRVSLSPRRVPEGRPALLRFTLSTAATVRIRITTLETRHRVGRRCSTRRRRCTVRVTLRRLHFHAGAGRNAFKLLRRRLPPGRYRVFIYATDIAGRSRTAQIGFTILKH
jgi:hypothetical protein